MIDPITLPPLLVVVPILLAVVPLVLGVRWDRTGWATTTVTCSGLFLGAVVLAHAVFVGGERVVHPLGGFPGPQGIELVADEFSTLIALLVAGTALGVLAYTRTGGPRGNTFYSGYLLLTGGLMGLTFTGDVFNMFVFLEITGLATYALVAKSDDPEAAVAALKYLIVGTVGASIYLIGVGLLFMATGTLNMEHLGSTLPETAGYDDPLVRAAFAFVFVGLAIKVAQWPLHSWQPDAYQRAPDGVTPLIAALVSTVSAYALGRVLFGVFTVDFLQGTPWVSEVIVLVGASSLVAGSVLAVMQPEVKRMLAYSSVSQFGLIVAAYGVVTETALVGAMIHLLGHGLMKVGLFVGVGVVAIGYGARRIDGYADLARGRPVAAAAMAALGLALVGIPPSIGFLGKWYIAVGAVEAEVWSIAALIFLSTMLTLLYVARLLETMYFTPTEAASGIAEPALATDGGTETDDGAAPEDGAPPDDGAAPDDGAETRVPGSDDEDSGPDSSGRERRSIGTDVSIGMLGLLVFVAVTAVVLGFAGGPLFDLLEPFATEVFDT